MKVMIVMPPSSSAIIVSSISKSHAAPGFRSGWCIGPKAFTEALLPFLKTQNFNDDNFARPIFHGAYQITNPNSEIENLFVHRMGYLIFQNKNDEFQDYQLEVDTTNHQLLLFDYRTKTNYTLVYQNTNNSITHISGNLGNFELDFELLKYNLKEVPLLKNDFSWTTN